jgi:hypothetical protein
VEKGMRSGGSEGHYIHQLLSAGNLSLFLKVPSKKVISPRRDKEQILAPKKDLLNLSKTQVSGLIMIGPKIAFACLKNVILRGRAGLLCLPQLISRQPWAKVRTRSSMYYLHGIPFPSSFIFYLYTTNLSTLIPIKIKPFTIPIEIYYS